MLHLGFKLYLHLIKSYTFTLQSRPCVHSYDGEKQIIYNMYLCVGACMYVC